MPTGKLSLVKPAGRDMAGSPAIFTGIVYKSERYISRGSTVFSPIINGGVGVVGDKIT